MLDSQTLALIILTALVSIAVTAAAVAAIMKRGRRAARSTGRIEAQLARLDGIADQLAELRSLFLVPRTRGEVGETLLAEMLGSYLPREAYDLQYQFRDGGRVDAVVRLGDAMVAIDAKFPMESIRRHIEEGGAADELPSDAARAFEKHAAAIADRYIRPAEGTMDFAVMYVPSEGVYYRAFAAGGGELLRTLLSHRVVPTGPSSLFLYLATIGYGLRGMKISMRAREMASLIDAVRQELELLRDRFEVTGTHVKNLNKAFADAEGRLNRLDGALGRLEHRRE